MTPTDELRKQLRRLLDEVIADGKTEADTRFTDDELNEVLSGVSSIEEAAYEGWMRKAMRAMSERGGIESSNAGDERHEFVSIKDYRDHCLMMAEHFKSKIQAKGSRIFSFEAPQIGLEQ